MNPPTRSRLALKGSAKQAAEFFNYAVNSILYQRGIYPPEDFKAVKKYGLNMLVTIDEQVKSYLRKILGQLNQWMAGGKIKKLILAITDSDSATVVERWQFDVETCAISTEAEDDSLGPESLEKIHAQIRALIRQITASTTFLPELVGRHTFTILVFADDDADVPVEWVDSDAKEVIGKNVESVQLRPFSTEGHRVSTHVFYRYQED